MTYLLMLVWLLATLLVGLLTGHWEPLIGSSIAFALIVALLWGDLP